MVRKRRGREREREKGNICEYARIRVCDGVRGTYANRRRGRAGKNLWKQEEGVYINASICIYIFFNLSPIP